MASTAVVQARLNSMSRAATVLPQLQTIYRQAQFAQSAINAYTAGTDPVFNQAVNDIFSAGERAQLQTMLTQLNSLVSAWTTNHSTLLGTNL